MDEIRSVLNDTLQLGDRAESLTDSTLLLGSIPEFDSMAVVTILMQLEERFGLVIEDDEITADIFKTVGSLRAFVEEKARA